MPATVRSGSAVTTSSEQDSLVRQAVYAAFVTRGTRPSRTALALATGLTPAAVAESYARLAASRALVLDPGSGEVWMAMPFSAIPTAFRVRSGALAWWANCAWDALGIAAATGRDVEIATTCPDCAAPLALHVRDGRPDDEPWVVHFLVPAARWWDDIGFT